MTEFLPVYEQTKAAMDFDPASPPQLPGNGGLYDSWRLEEDHPLTVLNRITQLANQLGWDSEQLANEWALVAWSHNKERSENEGQAQQEATPPPGHPGREAGGEPVESPPGLDGVDGTPGADQDGKGGKTQQVSRRRRKTSHS